MTGISADRDAIRAALGLASAATRRGEDDSSEDRSQREGAVLVVVVGSAGRDGAEAAPDARVKVVEAESAVEARRAVSAPDTEFDVAIIVAPAPQKSPECISLAGAVDAVILVASLGETKIAEAELAARLLRDVGVEPAAALLLNRHSGRGSASERTVGARAPRRDAQIGFAE